MTTRPPSDLERSALERALVELRKSTNERLQMLAGPSLTLLLLLGLLWSALNWLGRRFFNTDLGLYSSAAPWILGVAALVLVSVVAPEVLKSIKRSKSRTGALEADLALGTVQDVTISIVDAIRLQEPEHGGFIYFLRTTDERVYVQYDYESQDLGVDGQDPETSKYLPCNRLNVVRTQHEGRVLSSSFSGNAVPIVYKGKLTAKPRHWPEADSFCGTSWTNLVSVYAV